MTSPNFNSQAGPIAQAMNKAYLLAKAGTTEGSFACPKCGSTVKFTALVAGMPHRSSGKCSARGCIKWSN